MNIKIEASRDELRRVWSVEDRAGIADAVAEVFAVAESAIDGMEECGNGLPISVGHGCTFYAAGNPLAVEVCCDGE